MLPHSVNRSHAVIALFACFACSALLPGPAEAELPTTDAERQARSLETIETVSTALLSWFVDVSVGDPDEPAVQRMQESWKVQPQQDGVVHEYTRVPYEEIVGLLVPEYIEEVPRTNPWGHPCEFAVNENLRGAAVLSIRCPGKDGQFDSDLYVLGTFAEEDYGKDLVWADGLMIRQPGP